jgi:hypothetical protein
MSSRETKGIPRQQKKKKTSKQGRKTQDKIKSRKKRMEPGLAGLPGRWKQSTATEAPEEDQEEEAWKKMSISSLAVQATCSSEFCTLSKIYLLRSFHTFHQK